MRHYIILPIILLLCGCNYVALKPGTMESGEIVYAKTGGYSIRRAVKPELEERGYSVLVGETKDFQDADSSDGDIEVDSTYIPQNARYAINVKERREKFRPVWCFFNGYWWWNFNVSISDQQTGEELLAWAGRGCMNSSIRKFNRLMDRLEK